MKRRPRRGFGENGFEAKGGYMAAKKSKLAEQFVQMASHEANSSKTNGIFHGIAIFINGYTVPSADELKRIMMVHGGMFHQYMTDSTTHIIATNLPNVKIKRLRVMRVVKPEWITESVNAGKLLDFRNYLLYSHQSITQPKLQFGESNDSTSITENLSNSSVVQDFNFSPSTDILSFSNQCKQTPCEDLKCTHNPDGSVNTGNMATTSKADPSNDSEMEGRWDPSVVSDKQKAVDFVSTSLSSKIVSKLPSNVRSAGETGFLSEFYNNSRLHHLSTMGATFKQYVTKLRDTRNRKFLELECFKEWVNQQRKDKIDELEDDNPPIDRENQQIIMHIDMDCFFVSVGLRKYPELRGKPVAVTHAKVNQGITKSRPGVDRKAEFELYNQRHSGKDEKSSGQESEINKSRVHGIDETSSMSEIASCNYEARKAGLKNGMFLGSALKLCPDLMTIPYDFEGYKEVSYALYNTIAQYTLNIEAVSCDEMFVNCTSLLINTQAQPLDFATYIRKEIKEKTGCPASTGFGNNMLQARLANKRAKPDGQFYLTPENVIEFMKEIRVVDLPGVGRSISQKLQDLGAQNCEDLQQLPLAVLQKELGMKTGETLYQHCRGEDNRKLTYDHVRKSVSAEVNYGIRFTKQEEADKFLRELAGEVANRLKEINMRGRCVTLKLMVRAKDAPIESAKFMGHGYCDHVTKSTSVPRPVAKSDEIAWVVLAISRQLRVPPTELRGIGIQVSRLENESRSSGGLSNYVVRGSSINNINQQASRLETEVKPRTSRAVGCLDNFLLKQDDKDKLQISSQPTLDYPKKSELKKQESNTVDPDFLAALPEDIREEVMREYCQRNETEIQLERRQISSNQPGTSKQMLKQHVSFTQIEPSFLAALPEELRLEFEFELPKKECLAEASKTHETITKDAVAGSNNNVQMEASDIAESASSMLSLDLSLSDTRALIKEWVGSELQPQSCDVEMLSKHCQQLAATRNIYSLDLLLKCLHRCISAKKCTEWQETYHNIINKTQHTMETVYGSTLQVNISFMDH